MVSYFNRLNVFTENSGLYLLPSTWRHYSQCKIATETGNVKKIPVGALFVSIFYVNEKPIPLVKKLMKVKVRFSIGTHSSTVRN